MNILLTGATGLIGSRVGIELVRRGAKITALTRNGRSGDLAFPARCLSWDPLTPIDVASILPEHGMFDAVIHLAGEPVSQRWTRGAKARIQSSRVESTKNLVHAFSQSGQVPGIWLNASAIGYYGNCGQTPVDENSSVGQGFLPDVCKLWEDAVHPIKALSRVVSLRIGVVLAWEGGAFPVMADPIRYGVGGALASGRQGVSWVHIDDAVRAIIHAVETKSIQGPVNVTAPDPKSQSEFSHAVAKHWNRPNFLSTPSVVLKSLLGEMSTLAIDGAYVVPRKLMDSGFEFHFATLNKALEDLMPPMITPSTRVFTMRQWIPGTPDKHFPFFSAAENLEKITPPWLKFKILRVSSPVMGSGNLIDYKLRIKGLPITWRTRIEDWDPPRQFVDTQLKGPYDVWHHSHLFEELGGGTLMTDRVLYRMKFWPFGDAALPMVRHDVNTIFSYRRKFIEQYLLR